MIFLKLLSGKTIMESLDEVIRSMGINHLDFKQFNNVKEFVRDLLSPNMLYQFAQY